MIYHTTCQLQLQKILMQLYNHQDNVKTDIYRAWDSGASNVMAVMPTGSGKTVVVSKIVHEHHSVPTCAIAHRQELVSQLSIALARDGVRHRIIGQKQVVRLIVNQHMVELGKSFYDPSAHCAVAGVDTLVRRKESLAGWLNTVKLWVQDEGHHVLRSNKWGTAADMFPNAKGLAVTATPIRADGKGLGRHADGLIDEMVEGLTMRELINLGYLTDYRIFAPPSDLNLDDVNVTASGEFGAVKLKTAVQRSHIVGDVVAHYLRIAPGKRGVTFADSVETAVAIAAQYNAAGVPAAMVCGETPLAERIKILADFSAGKLLQLVNVDLFGEGFDLPAIEVVSMARPTQSFALFCQQFGRALRIMEGKTEAIIIDHVGNVDRHGLPDAVREWSLDRRETRGGNKANDAIPTRTCIECLSVYERIYKVCPYCGHHHVPAERGAPEFVDGDLTELDPATLAEMRGEVARIDGSVLYPDVADYIKVSIGKKHTERQETQKALRASIAWWAGYQRSLNRSDVEIYRRFYFMFGTDVMTAQTLNAKDAITLATSINNQLVKVVM